MELQFLREFRHLSQTLDDIRSLGKEDPYTPILDAVTRIVGLDRSLMLILSTNGENLQVVSSAQIDDSLASRMHFTRGREPSLLWKALETGTTQILHHPADTEGFPPDFFPDPALVVFACVPIFRGSEPLGLMMVDRAESGQSLSDEDLLQLEVLTDQIAIALQNHDLHQKLSQKALELETRDQRISKELQLAKLVQDGVLPRTAPTWPGLAVATYFQPAYGIGGDYYHYFDGCSKGKVTCQNRVCQHCANELYGLLIGDVCGKGIPAALVMAVVHSLFQEKVLRESDPGQLLTEVNLSMKEILGAETRFNTSAFLGFFDPAKHSFTYSNGGHDFPLFFEARTGRIIPLESTGTLLGLFRESNFHQRSLALASGDRLFFYTDGLLEFFEREFHSTDEFAGLDDFLRQHRSDSASIFIGHIRQLIESSGQKDLDDITAILLAVE